MNKMTIEEIEQMIELSEGSQLGIPIEVKATIDRYVKDKIPPGSFVRAVLANDFLEAVGRADVHNQRHLVSIAAYIYNNIPSNCHGSYKIVNAWLKDEK